MKPMNKLITLTAVLAAGSALAAEPGERRHPDPECLKRNADPEKCVIQDGPPPAPRVRKKVDLPPPVPVNQPQEAPQPGPARKP